MRQGRGRGRGYTDNNIDDKSNREKRIDSLPPRLRDKAREKMYEEERDKNRSKQQDGGEQYEEQYEGQHFNFDSASLENLGNNFYENNKPTQLKIESHCFLNIEGGIKY